LNLVPVFRPTPAVFHPLYRLFVEPLTYDPVECKTRHP